MVTPTGGKKQFGDDEDIGRAHKKRLKTHDIDTKVGRVVKERAPKVESTAPTKSRKILKRGKDDEGSIKPGSLKRPNTASVTPKERQ
ncbi:MAG: hypothetical protein LLF94_10830, partial [Chlamydiales bacterium]|nr:hypothetical protein [Chlamydiales bacterium]